MSFSVAIARMRPSICDTARLNSAATWRGASAEKRSGMRSKRPSASPASALLSRVRTGCQHRRRYSTASATSASDGQQHFRHARLQRGQADGPWR